MTDSWFERDRDAFASLERVLRARFPTLHAFIEDETCHVRGGFETMPGDRYGIDLALPADYPNSLLKVWETEGRIPREIDRHTFPDGSLCLGTPLALWLALDGVFTVEKIIDIPLRNFLVGNSLVEQGQPWPHRDQAHGAAGIIEHLAEVIGTQNPMTQGLFLIDLLHGKVRGHWTCPCGSGLIIRKCHREAIDQLRRVPPSYLHHAVDTILKVLKSERAAA